MGNTLSKAELIAIAQNWKQQQIELIEADHRNQPVSNQHTHAKRLSELELISSDIREAFALNNHSSLIPEATELLSNTTVSETDTQDLAFNLAKARLEAIQISINLLKGIPHTTSNVIYDQLDNADDLTRLSEAFDIYHKEKVANSDWSNKTAEKNTRSVSVMIELISDKHIQHLNKADVRQLKSLLPQLPTNIKKHSRFNGMTLTEVIQSEHTLPLISTSMVKQHLTLMSTFIEWAQNNGLTRDNPFNGMIPKDKKLARENRSSLTDGDIAKILQHPQVTPPEGNKTKAHQFWLPRIGMYTGARIEEICQLHCGDIQVLEGHACMVITDQRPDQQLKNKQSKRVIPIHHELIDIGFISYVDEVRSNSTDGLIFPELKPDKDFKYSSSPSKWFGRMKDKQGIDKDKTFHSFRHTMADKLRATLAQDYILKRILGHTTDSETHERYGEDKNVIALAETINAVSFNLSRA